MLEVFKRYKLLFLSLGISLGYLIALVFPKLLFQFTFCPFKSLYGIPCPACGLSRASIQLINGNWLEAFQINPLVYLVHPILVGIALFAFIDQLNNTAYLNKCFSARWSKYLVSILLLLFLINMGWNYQKGL